MQASKKRKPEEQPAVVPAPKRSKIAMSATYLKVSYDFTDIFEEHIPEEVPLEFCRYFEWTGSVTESALRALAALLLASKEEPQIIYTYCEKQGCAWENVTTLMRGMESARLITLPSDALEAFEKGQLGEFVNCAEEVIDWIAERRGSEDNPARFSDMDIDAMCETMQKSLADGVGFLYPLERNLKPEEEPMPEQQKAEDAAPKVPRPIGDFSFTEAWTASPENTPGAVEYTVALIQSTEDGGTYESHGVFSSKHYAKRLRKFLRHANRMYKGYISSFFTHRTHPEWYASDAEDDKAIGSGKTPPHGPSAWYRKLLQEKKLEEVEWVRVGPSKQTWDNFSLPWERVAVPVDTVWRTTDYC